MAGEMTTLKGKHDNNHVDKFGKGGFFSAGVPAKFIRAYRRAAWPPPKKRLLMLKLLSAAQIMPHQNKNEPHAPKRQKIA